MASKYITEQEHAMYEKGYVSLRIAVAKTKMHATTIQRLLRNDKLSSKRVANYRYISIESLSKYMGEDGVEMFGLDDWSAIYDSGTVEDNAA